MAADIETKPHLPLCLTSCVLDTFWLILARALL